MFLPFLHLNSHATILSLSVLFGNYWTIINPKFHSIWSSGSIFTAKSDFSIHAIGQKSGPKLLSPANFASFPYNSIEMSKNESDMVPKSRLPHKRSLNSMEKNKILDSRVNSFMTKPFKNIGKGFKSQMDNILGFKLLN